MSPVRRAPSELTSSESALRREYLQDVLGLLWPAPVRCTTGRPGATTAGARDFVVVPGLGRPRLLLPLDAPRAAATALRRYSEPPSRLARLRLEALAVAMATGIGPLVMRDRVRVEHGPDGQDDTVERHLADVLGRDVRVGLHIGPARANRKPVLQLLSPDGELLGFVKVGVNGLTRRLVAAEGRSLEHLAGAGLTRVETPGVLHSGTWRDLEILVQEPLPIWQRRSPLAPARLAEGMLEVASVGGVRREVLAASGFWTGLADGLAALSPTPTVLALRGAFDVLTRRAADVEVPVGSWHGDWTPWNMASVPGRLLVWDWERFEQGVPLGFDALHFELQSAVTGEHTDPRRAVARCTARAAELLDPFGVARDDAPVVALAYLVALAVRYLQDGQAEAGARLGVLGQWLLPELVDQVAAL